MTDIVANSVRGSGHLPARYVFVAYGFVGFLVLYAMRVNLSVAIVAMVEVHIDNGSHYSTECVRTNVTHRQTGVANGEFKWDQYLQGIILGSFFWGYVATQIPAGRLAEMVGSKYLLGGGILACSILALLSPLAARTNYILFIVCRAVQGMFQGAAYPAMHAMIAKWSPTYERGLMSTLIYTGGTIGTVITMPLTGFLCASTFLGGWPAAFYIIGCAGIVWSLLWLFFIHESPKCHPTIGQRELDTILKGQQGGATATTAAKTPVPWKEILTSVPVWALVVAHFGQNWGFYTLLFQLPTYFETVLHFNVTKNGVVNALPYLVEFLIGCLAGLAFDRIIRRGKMSVNVVRKFCNTVGLMGPCVCLILVTFAGCDDTMNIVLLTAALGLNGFVYSGYNVTHVDMSPAFAGTLMGITNCVANLAGILAPYTVGYLTRDNISLVQWSYVFYISSIVYIAATLVFLILGSAKLQKWSPEYDHRQPDGLQLRDAMVAST